jgi:hypothetical protein
LSSQKQLDMKQRMYRLGLCCVLSLGTLFTLTVPVSCEKMELEDDDPGSGGTSGGNGTGGSNGTNGSSGGSSNLPSGYTGSASGRYWSRNDGQKAALYLSGSTAKTCVNNVETIGSFQNSLPYSMTFTIQGNTIRFPLAFSNDGNTLIVGVPDQAINTNVATPYAKASSYTCGSTGGGSTTPEKGDFIIWTALPETGYGYSWTVRGPQLNFSGMTIKRFDSEPDCGTPGGLGFNNVNPGTYNYTITGKRKTTGSGGIKDDSWGGSFTVTGNSCTKVQLR